MIGAYGYILPSLTELNTSERLAIELERFAPDTDSQFIHSPHFTEPSLVYHIGKERRSAHARYFEGGALRGA